MAPQWCIVIWGLIKESLVCQDWEGCWLSPLYISPYSLLSPMSPPRLKWNSRVCLLPLADLWDSPLITRSRDSCQHQERSWLEFRCSSDLKHDSSHDRHCRFHLCQTDSQLLKLLCWLSHWLTAWPLLNPFHLQGHCPFIYKTGRKDHDDLSVTKKTG